MFDELIEVATQDFLTILQVEIFLARNEGKTYESLIKDFEFSGNAAFVTCLIRTFQFKVWYPGYEGYQDTYLSKMDQHYFYQYIIAAINYANCVPAIVASNLAFNLWKNRLKKASILLNKSYCHVQHVFITLFGS